MLLRLVTPVLSTALCKSSRIRHSPNSGTVRRFSLWNVFPPLKPAFFFPNSAPLNSGLWLGAFGKVWLFRCQSGIRGLWLTAFDKSEFFRCQSRSSRPTFWHRNRPALCKRPVPKLQNSAKPNSGTVCRFSMEESCRVL